MRFQPGISGNPQGRPVGSVNRQLRELRQAAAAVLPQVLAQALGGHFKSQELILKLATPKIKPVDVPTEFTLPEAGETAPVRAIMQQASAGEISLPHAEKLVYDLLPLAQQEQKALERQAQPSGFMNAYLSSVLNR